MKLSFASFLSFLLALFLADTAFAAAQRTTLYDFGGGLPGPLTLAPDGSLYGSAYDSQFYRLSPTAAGWRKDVLYQSVAGDGSGAGPIQALTLRDDGSLLGASQGLLGPGYGDVFTLTPPSGGASSWTKSVIHQFNGQNGQWPVGGFTPDGHGGFLGLTNRGGSADGGTLYRVTPPVSGNNWSVQTQLEFIWSNGSLPEARLVPNGQGAFYAILAGSKDIISLTPPAAGQSAWTETVLHNFPAPLWEYRWPLVIDKNGAIYGTTANKIFRLIPPTAKQKKWKAVILMSFSKKNSVQNGFGLSGVIVDANGVLYGVTSQGGSSTACGKLGCGTLFKLTPPPAGQTKYSYTVLDQTAGGMDGLIADPNGVLYGTTGNAVFMVTGSGFQP